MKRILRKYFSSKASALPDTITKISSPTIFPYKDEEKKLKVGVLDFSGTTLDAHVIAPAIAFVRAFKVEGVDISMDEARIPMGLRKDLHILKLLEMPTIIDAWEKVLK